MKIKTLVAILSFAASFNCIFYAVVDLELKETARVVLNPLGFLVALINVLLVSRKIL